MQNAQEKKRPEKKTMSGLYGIHEKKENLLTRGKSMIKSNPSRFYEILVM